MISALMPKVGIPTSPALRRYYKLLWSKSLLNGALFDLRDDVSGAYLYHASDLGEFFLGSDAITHLYKYQKGKQWLIQRSPMKRKNCSIQGQ